MKRMMSIAAIALFMAGSSAFACETCGCKAEKEKGKDCTTCTKDGEKCAEGCTKECCAPKDK